MNQIPVPIVVLITLATTVVFGALIKGAIDTSEDNKAETQAQKYYCWKWSRLYSHSDHCKNKYGTVIPIEMLRYLERNTPETPEKETEPSEETLGFEYRTRSI